MSRVVWDLSVAVVASGEGCGSIGNSGGSLHASRASQPQSPASDAQQSQLLSSIEASFESGEFADVQFEVAGEYFHGHKLVLCTGSDYFRKMLTSDFREAQELQVVPISGMSAHTFRSILQFIYTGKVCELHATGVVELIRVADEFCLLRLVQLCAERLESGLLSTLNCCEVLQEARLRQPQQDVQSSWHGIAKLCLRFIAENLKLLILADSASSEARVGLSGLSLSLLADVITEASEQLSQNTSMIPALWQVVLQAAQREVKHVAITDCADFLQYMEDLHWETLDFVQPCVFTFELDGVPTGMTNKSWRSNIFKAGGFEWKVLVDKDLPSYDAYLELCSRADWPSIWMCSAACTFGILRKHEPESAVRKPMSASLFSLHSRNKANRWGYGPWLSIATVEGSPDQSERGFVIDSKLTVEVQVKANPLFGLCAAASTLTFQLSMPRLLNSQSAALLVEVLNSDHLGIDSETQLFDGLVDFVSAEDSGEDAASRLKRFQALLPLVRLHFVDLFHVLDAAKERVALQSCSVFRDALQDLVSGKPPLPGTTRRGLRPSPASPQSMPDASASSSSSHSPLSGRKMTHARKRLSPADDKTFTAEQQMKSMVDWLLQPLDSTRALKCRVASLEEDLARARAEVAKLRLHGTDAAGESPEAGECPVSSPVASVASALTPEGGGPSTVSSAGPSAALVGRPDPVKYKMLSAADCSSCPRTRDA